jgi:hypothetical protein
VDFFEILLIQRKSPFIFAGEILSFPNYGPLQFPRKPSWETSICRPLILQTLISQLIFLEVGVVGDIRLCLGNSG